MARHFERINVSEARDSLHVAINATDPLGTVVSPRPPMSRFEYGQLVAGSEFGEELTPGYISDKRVWITLEGEPTQHHLELGLHVAEELAALRGIKMASVSHELPDRVDSYVIFERSA